MQSCSAMGGRVETRGVLALKGVSLRRHGLACRLPRYLYQGPEFPPDEGHSTCQHFGLGTPVELIPQAAHNLGLAHALMSMQILAHWGQGLYAPSRCPKQL